MRGLKECETDKECKTALRRSFRGDCSTRHSRSGPKSKPGKGAKEVKGQRPAIHGGSGKGSYLRREGFERGNGSI